MHLLSVIITVVRVIVSLRMEQSMSQYIIDPFDPTETSAINLIQPNERPYPVVPGKVRQNPGNTTYTVARHHDGKDTIVAVVEGDGILPGVVEPHLYNRRVVLAPDADSSQILAIETAVNSKTFIAVRTQEE